MNLSAFGCFSFISVYVACLNCEHSLAFYSLVTLVLAMYGIIHGGPVVPLTLTARRFVSFTTGTRCMPKVYSTTFSLPMACDF